MYVSSVIYSIFSSIFSLYQYSRRNAPDNNFCESTPAGESAVKLYGIRTPDYTVSPAARVIFSRSQGRSRRSGPRRVETPKMLWILSMCIQRRLILSLSVCGYTLKSVTFAYGYTQVCLQIFWCFFVLFIHFRYFAYILVQHRSITRYHTKLFSLLWLNLYNARLLH